MISHVFVSSHKPSSSPLTLQSFNIVENVITVCNFITKWVATLHLSLCLKQKRWGKTPYREIVKYLKVRLEPPMHHTEAFLHHSVKLTLNVLTLCNNNVLGMPISDCLAIFTIERG